MNDKKCQRCGICCKQELCDVALAVFEKDKQDPPCPALEPHSDRTYSCGLMLHASEYMDIGEYAVWKDEYFRKIFSNMLGVGKGCCDNSR